MLEIYQLSEAEISYLAASFKRADANGGRVKIAMDGGLKVQVDYGMWSASIGKKQEAL